MKKIVLTLTTIFTVLMLMVSIPLYTFAVSQSDKNALQNKINNAKSELKNIQNSQRDAKSELENLTIQVMDAENELDSLKAELSELESSIETKESEITEKQAEIKRKEKLLQERIVALYEAGDSTYLDVLLGSDSLLDFLSKYEIVQQIVDADTALITDLDNDKKALENEKAELEADKARVKELKDKQEIKSNELKILKKNKQSEVDKLSDEEKSKQSEIDKYNTAMEEVNRQLSEIGKDAQERLDRDGVKFDGSFIWPCNNKYVTSRMKWRWGRWHKGIDIGASYENVYASASGYAYNATNPGGYGTYIMIFHGDGYATLYGHLNSSHIRNGQYVSQGQVIATSGNSGGSTGAHLHFEIRHSTSISNFFGNNWLNPLDYLPGGYTILD
ncbi:MAG: peptidoglycan DD-metalloendopeptidase family protein [Clostridium sp.]|nr:peptidoglycan DD-metalloendopeptidase family protein [Clostridium sp.]